MSFKVLGGSLGITVSPLLYRLRPSPYWEKRLVGRAAITDKGTEATMTPRVIHTLEDVGEYQQGETLFLALRGELVKKVLLLVKILEGPNHSKQKKMVKALLSTGEILG
jgi:hypothetical protein